MTKAELRAELRKKRRAFVEDRGGNCISFDHLSDKIYNILINKDKNIALYCATDFEIDVSQAVKTRGADARMSLPAGSSKAEPIQFLSWSFGDPLVKSPLGFMQPEDDAAIVHPDVIFTPLLGFDANLARLGQGAGHYDRTFEALPDALRIGVAWSVQQVNHVPVEAWDIPLDAVITEKALLLSPKNRLEF